MKCLGAAELRGPTCTGAPPIPSREDYTVEFDVYPGPTSQGQRVLFPLFVTFDQNSKGSAQSDKLPISPPAADQDTYPWYTVCEVPVAQPPDGVGQPVMLDAIPRPMGAYQSLDPNNADCIVVNVTGGSGNAVVDFNDVELQPTETPRRPRP